MACVGAFFPPGTRIRFRFFLNQHVSEWRDVYFGKTTTPEWLWNVPGDIPQAVLCGIEVTTNIIVSGIRQRNQWRSNYKDLSQSTLLNAAGSKRVFANFPISPPNKDYRLWEPAGYFEEENVSRRLRPQLSGPL